MNRELHRIDLNLLKVLHVLIEEQNVTHAAERLFLAQPSVSRKLKQLREQLGDELFISTPYGMKPTTRCEQIAQLLPELIQLLEQTLIPRKAFEPATQSGHVALTINPLLGQSLPNELFLFLRQYAPKLTLSCHQWNPYSLDSLAKDTVQIGVNYQVPVANKPILARELAQDKFKLYARKGHPIFNNKKLDFKLLSQCQFTIAAMSQWNEKEGMMESMLRERGLQYNEIFRSEIISNVAAVTSNTDALFPTSELYITSSQQLQEIDRDKLPESRIKPIMFYFHKKRELDPLYQWLENSLAQLIAKMKAQS